MAGEGVVELRCFEWRGLGQLVGVLEPRVWLGRCSVVVAVVDAAVAGCCCGQVVVVAVAAVVVVAAAAVVVAEALTG